MMRLTSGLKLLSRNAQDGFLGALQQLQQCVDCTLISGVDGKENTLNGLALVRLGLGGLFSTASSQS